MSLAVIGEFALGFSAPFRGLHLLANNSRLLKWAVIPFLIGLAVMVVGAYFGISYLVRLLPAIMTEILAIFFSFNTWTFKILYFLSLALAWPMAVFALFYVLLMLAKLLAEPFFALLAEKVLRESGAVRIGSCTKLKSWPRRSAKEFVFSSGKLVAFGGVGIVFFFVSMIPGLGLLTAGGFLFLAAFDIADVSFEALGWPMQERFAFARRHAAFLAGLGACLGLLFLVPGINFVLLPIAIAGTADMVQNLGDRKETHGTRHDSPADRSQRG